jgi:hypothetical protein
LNPISFVYGLIKSILKFPFSLKTVIWEIPSIVRSVWENQESILTLGSTFNEFSNKIYTAFCEDLPFSMLFAVLPPSSVVNIWWWNHLKFWQNFILAFIHCKFYKIA